MPKIISQALKLYNTHSYKGKHLKTENTSYGDPVNYYDTAGLDTTTLLYLIIITLALTCSMLINK